LIERKVTSTSCIDIKEGNNLYQDMLVSFLCIKMCLVPSFLSRCACYLPFCQDVLGTFLSIKMCLFPSFLSRYACPFFSIEMYLFPVFLSRYACSHPFYQDVLVPFLLEQAHIVRKEVNKHILIERKRTSTS
jgi:hypothetical protein